MQTLSQVKLSAICKAHGFRQDSNGLQYDFSTLCYGEQASVKYIGKFVEVFTYLWQYNESGDCIRNEKRTQTLTASEAEEYLKSILQW